jgi:hypothetical protein
MDLEAILISLKPGDLTSGSFIRWDRMGFEILQVDELGGRGMSGFQDHGWRAIGFQGLLPAGHT